MKTAGWYAVPRSRKVHWFDPKANPHMMLDSLCGKWRFVKGTEPKEPVRPPHHPRCVNCSQLGAPHEKV